MKFELPQEYAMIKDLVRKFVDSELIPLEAWVLQREASGQSIALSDDDRSRIEARSKALGLWGLDGPEEIGGQDLPAIALVGVNEEIGRTITPFVLPPDSPNLSMMLTTATDAQMKTYVEPYVRGETISAIGISEPGAGSDPMAMTTTAVKDGDEWVLNGRKIWISRANEADFTIVMAVTEKRPEGRNAISAFLVDQDTPGFNVLRPIPMLGGQFTYEIALEDCRIPLSNLLGKEGDGFAPMQKRLGTRRVEMASWSIGMAQRALDMMLEYAPLRTTFGTPLSQRQTIQNWIAEAATKIHAARLMTYDCAWKIDQKKDVRREISMIKAYAVEAAYEIVDRTMQMFGAIGVSKEMPLHMMATRLRTMRIYDGPTEVHKWVVARSLIRAGA